jgi:hypothetical protein
MNTEFHGTFAPVVGWSIRYHARRRGLSGKERRKNKVVFRSAKGDCLLQNILSRS